MTIIYIILGLFILFLIIGYSSNPEAVKRAPKNITKIPPVKMLGSWGDGPDDFWTYIAGAHHYNNDKDTGAFYGLAVRDRKNTHDSRAVGIYRQDGVFVGYVPAKELDYYYDWCGGNPMPCTYIVYKLDGKIRGRVAIVKPINPEQMEKAFGRFVKHSIDNYGMKFVPSGSLNLTIED